MCYAILASIKKHGIATCLAARVSRIAGDLQNGKKIDQILTDTRAGLADTIRIIRQKPVHIVLTEDAGNQRSDIYGKNKE